MLEVKYQTVWSSVTWLEYKRLKVSSQVICSPIVDVYVSVKPTLKTGYFSGELPLTLLDLASHITSNDLAIEII